MHHLPVIAGKNRGCGLELADSNGMHRVFKGILLDIDGTLVESNEAHALAWEHALRDYGWRFSLDEICPLIGMGSDHLLPRLIGASAKTPQGKAVSNMKNEIFRKDFLPHLQPTCGAKALVEKLCRLGLKAAVATSASEEEVGDLLKICGAQNLLPVRTTKSEAGASKPSPDVVEIALGKIGTFPAETLMIGDTPYDIQAALKLGVQTIAFRCGGWTDDELTGAIAIYDHPADLLANLEFSPLAGALLSDRQAKTGAA